MEEANAAPAAPCFRRAEEGEADSAALMLPPDPHDVELDRPRRVLLETEEAHVRLHGERRERSRRLDVRRGRLLDPEPLRKVAKNDLGDARPRGRVGDLDDMRHGRPVTRRPA